MDLVAPGVYFVHAIYSGHVEKAAGIAYRVLDVGAGGISTPAVAGVCAEVVSVTLVGTIGEQPGGGGDWIAVEAGANQCLSMGAEFVATD
jgi:hypothetical protein